ncbi:MAG: CopD family protein [Gemmatimonadota bacterium]
MTGLVFPVLQQWLLFSGAAIVVGCVAWGAVVAPRTATMIDAAELPRLHRIEHRVAWLGVVTTLALVAVWMLRGLVQLVNFRDPFVPLSEDVSFLLGETWGKVWMAQGAILPVLALAFWRARATSEQPGHASLPTAWKAAGVLVLLLTVTLAMSSHAMGVDTARPLLVTADALHSLAAGIWIGSLGLILATGSSSRSLFAAQLRSFSPMALVSVSMLVAMGVVLAWTHVGTPANLWETSYGRVLSAKVGVAGLVFALGLVNWRRGLPASDTAEGEAALRRRAASEVGLAAGVILLTALLVHTAKP